MTIALVASQQTNWAGNSGAGGTTAALDTTGASLIVIAVSRNVTTPSTVTDNKGNTYTKLTTQSQGNSVTYFWYCINPTVGTGHTFTVGSGYPNLIVSAWSGAKTSGTFLAESGTTSAGATTLQPGNLSPSYSNCLVLNSISHLAASSSISAGTILQSRAFTSGTSIGGALAYQIQTAAAATNPTWTIGSSTTIAVAQAIFLAADSVAATLSATASLTVRTATTATVVASPAGGTPVYGYQWYRSTTSGFTPGAGNIVSGATSATLAQTGLTEGTTYYYVCRVTDAAAGSVDTSQVAAYPVYTSSAALIAWSPYNWYDSGTYRQAISAGAYIKIKFSGASLNLLVSSSVADLVYSVDGGAFARTTVTSGLTSISIASGLSTGVGDTHYVTILLGAVDYASRWTSPTSIVRVTGIALAAGGALFAPTVYSDSLILYGDSNSEGYELRGAGSTVANQDSSLAFPMFLMDALACEVGVVGYASQGYTATGSGGVPVLPSAWDLYFAGQSRLTAGALSPAPKYILSMHGQNDSDSSAVQTQAGVMLAAWRAAAPAAKIGLCATNASRHQSQFQAAISTFADSNAKYCSINNLDLRTKPAYANSSVHLNQRGHAVYAAALAANIQAAFATGGGGETNTDLWDQLRAIAQANGMELIEQ